MTKVLAQVAGQIIEVDIVGPATFNVDGGSATTTYVGVLKVDFGSAS